MSVLLAICLVGGAVFAKLPADHPPTLRQAIAAAGVPAQSAHVSNLDKQMASWSYECDGANYAAAYFDTAGRLWIARYDDGKKTWSESSSTPPGPGPQPAQAQQVITLFYDGYYLYVQLQDPKGNQATLQFDAKLGYEREFMGKTWSGLADGSLFYQPNADALPGDPLAAIFDPDTGASRAIFPPATPTAIIERGEKVAAQDVAACGQSWFHDHGLTIDEKNPLRGLIGARSDIATDSLAFAVVYGADNRCERAGDDAVAAVYVILHPEDAKRMKLVEQPLDVKNVDLDTLDLGTYLTKASIAKLFGQS